MSSYKYRARDSGGNIKVGAVESLSAAKAAETLHRMGLTVLDLDEQRPAPAAVERLMSVFNRVSRKDVVFFSRQLATLINANMPIIQAFEILIDQVTKSALKQALAQMMADVKGGKSLSDAAAAFPNIFSPLYVNLMKAGELSGTLDKSLVYLADQQEKDYDLAKKIRGAMIYPIFIVTAIFVVGGLMFVFVLPQMIDVLLESGAELPFTTKILIFLTGAIQKYWPFIITAIIGTIVGSQMYIRSTGGRLVWDFAKLRLPIFGKILQNIYMDRFSRNLSSLVAAGIPIVQALKTVADIVGNVVYREIILQAAVEVESGRSIAAVFADRPEIPMIVTQMIKVGEQTSTLHEILAKMADFYDKEVNTMVGTLTTLLEPVIMLVLGAAVAALVAGILLPIYNLASVQ